MPLCYATVSTPCSLTGKGDDTNPNKNNSSNNPVPIPASAFTAYNGTDAVTSVSNPQAIILGFSMGYQSDAHDIQSLHLKATASTTDGSQVFIDWEFMVVGKDDPTVATVTFAVVAFYDESGGNKSPYYDLQYQELPLLGSPVPLPASSSFSTVSSGAPIASLPVLAGFDGEMNDQDDYELHDFTAWCGVQPTYPNQLTLTGAFQMFSDDCYNAQGAVYATVVSLLSGLSTPGGRFVSFVVSCLPGEPASYPVSGGGTVQWVVAGIQRFAFTYADDHDGEEIESFNVSISAVPDPSDSSQISYSASGSVVGDDDKDMAHCSVQLAVLAYVTDATTNPSLGA